MQYLVLTRRRTDVFAEAAFTERLADEAQGVRRLFVEGFIRQIWHRSDALGAAILVEAASEEDVVTTLKTLPLLGADMLEITTMTSLKPYGGFGPR